MTLPGDEISYQDMGIEDKTKVKIGVGIRQRGDHILAEYAGTVVKYSRKQDYKLWMVANHKRYIPQAKDMIIGRVVDKMGDFLHIDMSAPFRGVLPLMSFEGATKKNRPDAKIGTLVYARVVSATPGMDVELSCVDEKGKSCGFGILHGGYHFTVHPHLVYILLDQQHPLYQALSKKCPFEIAIGLNGKAWIKADSPVDTLLLSQMIVNGELSS